MNILVELINNAELCSGKHDTRYHILVDVCKRLHTKGHVIYALYKKHAFSKRLPFKKYQESHNKLIDFYIGHNVYQGSQVRYNYFKKRQIPICVYEAGWLKNSLYTDRWKLFGDSYYYSRIANLIQENFHLEKALELKEKLINTGTSKWPQKSQSDIPDVDYIFIPGQVLHDASIVYYSKTDLLSFIKKVVAFANQHQLHVVYKPHPGLSEGEKHGKKELEAFTTELAMNNKNFHIISTSIYDLMKKAKFTACVNAGTMFDNMVTQTPVYACGRSFFTRSGAIVFNEDVSQGLSTMLNQNYDLKHMQSQQLKLMWWVHQYLLQEELSADENIQRLNYHIGLNL